MQRVMFTLLLSFIVFACQKNDDSLMPSVTDAAQGEGENTKISDLEGQGVRLFKTTLKIADASGKNTVTLQLASESQAILNNYIKSTEFTLKVFGDVVELPKQEISGVADGKFRNTGEAELYEVVVDRTFAKGVVAYGILHKVKANSASVGSATGARTASFTYGTWIESYVYDNYMDVYWRPSGNTNDGLFVQCFYRNCALCSWSTDPATKNLLSSDPYFRFRRDGTRRLAVRVNHNWYNYDVYFGTV